MLEFWGIITLYMGLDVWHDWDLLRQVEGRSRGLHWKAADVGRHALMFGVAAYAFISTQLLVISLAVLTGGLYRWIAFDMGLNLARDKNILYIGSVGVHDVFGRKLGPIHFLLLKIVLFLISLITFLYTYGVQVLP